jgi:hypothetical protein
MNLVNHRILQRLTKRGKVFIMIVFAGGQRMRTNHLRALAKVLACLQGQRFAGAVIMRAEWSVCQAARGQQEPLQVLKDRHNLMAVCCRTEGEQLLVTMLLGHKPQQLAVDLSNVDKSDLTSQRSKWTRWAIPAAEVQAFTAAVGDGNDIHKGAVPVIPGLLLLEKLLGQRPADAGKVTLRFFHAAYAGDVFVDWSSGKLWQKARCTASFAWQ